MPTAHAANVDNPAVCGQAVEVFLQVWCAHAVQYNIHALAPGRKPCRQLIETRLRMMLTASSAEVVHHLFMGHQHTVVKWLTASAKLSDL